MKPAIEARIAQLSDEIRNYPTPIARCDLHLPALLEERASLLSMLESLEQKPGCPPEAAWVNDGGFDAA